MVIAMHASHNAQVPGEVNWVRPSPNGSRELPEPLPEKNLSCNNLTAGSFDYHKGKTNVLLRTSSSCLQLYMAPNPAMLSPSTRSCATDRANSKPPLIQHPNKQATSDNSPRPSPGTSA